MEGYVYILKSDKTGAYYIGSAKKLEFRIKSHKMGRVKSTKHLLPVEVAFFKKYADIADARRIEYRLKIFKSRKIIEKIIREGDIKISEGS